MAATASSMGSTSPSGGTRISSMGSIISKADGSRTSPQESIVHDDTETVSDGVSKDMNMGDFTKGDPRISIEKVERYRPYSVLCGPITPFARLLPTSELASDNFDFSPLANLFLNTFVLTSGGFIMSMLRSIVREPAGFWTRRDLLRTTMYRSYRVGLGCSFVFALGQLLRSNPDILQLEEEHLFLKLKEKNGLIEDMRMVFDAEEYKTFMERSTLDGYGKAGIFAGAGVGAGVGSLVQLILRAKRKEGVSLRPVLRAAFFGASLGFTGMSVAYSTTESAGREKLQQYRRETREAHMADLARIKEINSARASRIAELKKLSYLQRVTLRREFLGF